MCISKITAPPVHHPTPPPHVTAPKVSPTPKHHVSIFLISFFLSLSKYFSFSPSISLPFFSLFQSALTSSSTSSYLIYSELHMKIELIFKEPVAKAVVVHKATPPTVHELPHVNIVHELPVQAVHDLPPPPPVHVHEHVHELPHGPSVHVKTEIIEHKVFILNFSNNITSWTYFIYILHPIHNSQA